MFRIVNPQNPAPNKPVVFLQHGLLSNSYSWVENSKDKAPAFQFVKAGYDVWLGNNRGNSHSIKHSKKKPTDSSYYNYSF
jgi:pimeloyl-ACP methyl ester carboxylesterase